MVSVSKVARANVRGGLNLAMRSDARGRERRVGPPETVNEFGGEVVKVVDELRRVLKGVETHIQSGDGR